MKTPGVDFCVAMFSEAIDPNISEASIAEAAVIPKATDASRSTKATTAAESDPDLLAHRKTART